MKKTDFKVISLLFSICATMTALLGCFFATIGFFGDLFFVYVFGGLSAILSGWVVVESSKGFLKK